ncbi:nucleoside 2-deoxyribosyltransferase [Kaistia dalseonensis]|uniref:Nucleoside 2-deoxyribosyltransferase n=1 Tax=Kaistia dalseonensis TaxID=410840 RepID=A0ABU0H9E3_9HYPH|nr:nucleoside 2-deoxyribosyltransferase [Kaistia dalseonensis]MCX5495527.1 nucleoside 2-deoxyribosyltransferase [Kaistia dalseonensis]MDQ0438119.1 nucleoside 2-deoxyribosyltransferase [Kaistia dalseonensis]
MAAMKVYLAGPDVFLKNGREVIAAKQELTRRYGFVPNVWMGEDDAPHSTPFAFGLHISAANEAVMRDSDFIIANLTPFRGISADVGTAYELGFMVAHGKPAFGYSNDGRLYAERLTADYYKGAVAKADDGMMRGPDGLMVENNDMGDNLMLDGGIEHMGGVFIRRSVAPEHLLDDLGPFEECLAAARARLLGVAA